MYKFKKYNSKPFRFWDIKNKFIKKKTNKFISTKTFEKSLKSKVDFEKSTAKQKVDKTFKNKTFEKVLNQNSTKNDKNIHNFREIDNLMTISKHFLSFKQLDNVIDDLNVDNLLNDSLLLIVCTKLISNSITFNKKIYQRIFGKKWRDIQSML